MINNLPREDAFKLHLLDHAIVHSHTDKGEHDECNLDVTRGIVAIYELLDQDEAMLSPQNTTYNVMLPLTAHDQSLYTPNMKTKLYTATMMLRTRLATPILKVMAQIDNARMQRSKKRTHHR